MEISKTLTNRKPKIDNITWNVRSLKHSEEELMKEIEKDIKGVYRYYQNKRNENGHIKIHNGFLRIWSNKKNAGGG